MFTKAKHIDRAFQYIRKFSLFFLAACTLLTAFVIYQNDKRVENMKSRIYVLINGKLFEAFELERKRNIPVELRDHIKTFHEYFFTLSPDEKVIDENIKKALYLADGSANREYENLKESGYYNNIITGNISEQIDIDSVQLNMESAPYYFRLYGRLKIIRSTSVVTRSLITEGYVSTANQQSDNNNHGFMIERWMILENKDLKTENR